jgi:hypothetical protein
MAISFIGGGNRSKPPTFRKSLTNLITLFQIMVDNPRMTATEVMEKAQEKSMLLAPLLDPIFYEYVITGIVIFVFIRRRHHRM